jgi:hypothetical protein
MAEKKHYQIGLVEGKSHTGPDGYRWQAGKFRTMAEGEPYCKHYTTSTRFAHQELRPGQDGAASPRRRQPRSRRDVREDRAERERSRIEDRRDERDEDEIEDDLGEHEDHEEEIDDDPEPKPAPRKEPARKSAPRAKKYSDSVLKNARRTVPDSISREAANLLAHKLGIEDAEEIGDLPELVSRITQRQAEILADAAGG